MAKILLVRHGETEYNSLRRFMGHSDIELSKKGVRQVKLLGSYLAQEQIDFAFASDLHRTLSSARIILGNRNIEVKSCPELREIRYGECEGLTFQEISRKFPETAFQCSNYSPDLSFPGGEEFNSFAARVASFAARLKTIKKNDTVLVVSHMGPIGVLICKLLEITYDHWWQFRTDTASLSIVESNITGNVLARLNDASFLHSEALRDRK